MTLGQKQRLFARLVGALLARIHEQGYEATLDWTYRPPDVAEKLGMRDSLHTLKLAIDINLFRDGRYLRLTEAHRPIGEWWEQQHPLCRWGGRFGDGNHYSLSHGGKS